MGGFSDSEKRAQRHLLGIVAWELLEFCDPATYCLSSNITGVNVYLRCHGPKTTAWERDLWDSGRQLPAAWTGYLSHSVQKTSEKWTKYSSTSSHLPDTSPTHAHLSQGEGDVSSLNRLLLLMQEYLSVGRPLEVKSMKDVCLSICKEISGS